MYNLTLIQNTRIQVVALVGERRFGGKEVAVASRKGPSSIVHER